jgi:hypothetical protein
MQRKINKIWSDNPLILAILGSSLFIFFSSILSYILTFYFKRNTDSALLYTSVDPGYVTPGYPDLPIFGVHYFGDLLSQLSFAFAQNPYAADLGYPSPYLPFSIVIFKPFLHFNPIVLVPIISLISIGLVGFAIKNLLKNLEVHIQILFLLFCVFLTRPFLLALDRGNIQAIVVGLSMLFVIKWEQGSRKVASLLLVIAVSLKGYPILLVLVMLRDKKYREATRVIFLSGLISITSMLLISPRELMSWPVGMLRGMGVQSGYSTSGLSWAASISRLADWIGFFEPVQGHDTRFSLLAFCVGVTTLAFMLNEYVRSSIYTKYFSSAMILSIPTFMIPVSWGYNAIWVPFLILITYREYFLGSKFVLNLNRKVVISTLIGLLAISIVPFPFLWSGSTRVAVGLMEIFLPLIFLFFMISMKIFVGRNAKE